MRINCNVIHPTDISPKTHHKDCGIQDKNHRKHQVLCSTSFLFRKISRQGNGRFYSRNDIWTCEEVQGNLRVSKKSTCGLGQSAGFATRLHMCGGVLLHQISACQFQRHFTCIWNLLSKDRRTVFRNALPFLPSFFSLAWKFMTYWKLQRHTDWKRVCVVMVLVSWLQKRTNIHVI